jgi:AraC-like DNA-binding protein
LHFSREVVAQAGLAPTIHALIEEANALRLGKSIVLTRLADVLVVLVIRAWVADPANEARGWLRALRDQPITAALTHMHTAPHQSWTVARLAREVAMSRSAFSARFSELVGEPPLRYLTRWRMQVAARLLRTTALSMHEVAERVGYESGVAFSKAFKRERGINPGRFQRDQAVG